ncbi:MAG: metallophosphoesterase [Gammaproteobacteria bacterium]|nr:MAG: metallophosphoesterase [Gammaproteobacteria bacterium]
MIICILSDSHDHRELLAAAAQDAVERGAEAILHCGDIVAPSTLHAICKLDIPIHVIHGNNMGDTYHLTQLARQPDNTIVYHGQDAVIELGGRRIFMVHFPHYAKAMALTGDYDLVCNGHEHKAVIEHIKNNKGCETLRVDPGTVGGVSALATYSLGNLETMKFEILQVPEPSQAGRNSWKSQR